MTKIENTNLVVINDFSEISIEHYNKINIGICNLGPGWGDALVCTSLPENFFKATNSKLIDVNKHFVFDYNPFVLRDKNVDLLVNMRALQDRGVDICDKRGYPPLSLAEKITAGFYLKETPLRHTRLYKFEDSKTIKNKVIIHTEGKSVGKMPEKVMEKIRENYSDYDLFQIGGKDDIIFDGAKNLRGLNFWDTCKEISEAAIYIGVDSCFVHVADAYPKVRVKYVIVNIGKEDLKKFHPIIYGVVWWDFNREGYNIFEEDIGASESYLKI